MSDDINELARHVAQKAMSAKVPLAEKIDALKALTALEAVRTRAQPKKKGDAESPEVAEGRSFQDFSEAMGDLEEQVAGQRLNN